MKFAGRIVISVKGTAREAYAQGSTSIREVPVEADVFRLLTYPASKRYPSLAVVADGQPGEVAQGIEAGHTSRAEIRWTT